MNPNILIVDDSGMVRRAVAKALSGHECNLYEAENGMVAMQMMDKHNPVLVILDYNMPGMNGMDVLQAMKEEGLLKTTKVMMLTANNSTDTVVAIARMGVRDYLTKPFEPEQIVQRVTKLIPLDVSPTVGLGDEEEDSDAAPAP
ncbi:OmpR Response regulators consisting of a CheY-like receiver domain and a winged-helix DNA-binding domain [Comamonadaceae bacterium]